MKRHFLPLFCITIFVLLCSCSSLKTNDKNTQGITQTQNDNQSSSQDTSTKDASAQEIESVVEAEPAPTIAEASFVAVGDNLIHEPIYRQAHERTAKRWYDFRAAYVAVAPYFIFSDFVFINQETIILPSTYEPSTYPRFATPADMANQLIDMGFNMFSIANNHILDRGEQALADSLAFWAEQRTKNIIYSGAFASEDAVYEIPTITKNGITLSLVAFTTTLNGLSLPKNSSLRVLTSNDEEKIKTLVQKARTMSDIVVVSAHWGEEYVTKPNEYQTQMAQKLADWGADLIVGTHPHVIQPVEEITASDGRNVLVAYSLGNFISAQNQGQRLVGALLSCAFEKNLESGKTIFKDVTITPVITQYDKNAKNIAVYPITMYTPEQARTHGVKMNTSNFNYNYVLNTVKKVIDQKYLSLPASITALEKKLYELFIQRAF